jgi:hypothetical protein
MVPADGLCGFLCLPCRLGQLTKSAHPLQREGYLLYPISLNRDRTNPQREFRQAAPQAGRGEETLTLQPDSVLQA